MRVAVELAEMTGEPAYTINQFVSWLTMSGYFPAPASHETFAPHTFDSLGSGRWPLGGESERPKPTTGNGAALFCGIPRV